MVLVDKHVVVLILWVCFCNGDVVNFQVSDGYIISLILSLSAEILDEKFRRCRVTRQYSTLKVSSAVICS